MTNEGAQQEQAEAEGSGTSADPLIGRVFGDNYELEALIGVGGMGRVYRAKQVMLSRTVGVKVIHPHLLEDEDTVSRFYTEARAASSLNHPNSVSIFDFGRTDDGMLYLVMEFLRGRDLARIIQEEGALDIRRIVDIASGVLEALSEAHARGVVHCDLKPENVIIERLRSGTDLVKVVDFGLAKIRGAEPAGDAARGLVSGTPDYMSPEQARAIDVDGRGDLYSLGVVLFELLTARLPFLGQSAAEVMTSHVMDEAPKAIDIAPYRGIPQPLSELVFKAMSKLPDERFLDAAEMAASLRSVSEGIGVSEDTIACTNCGTESGADRKFCAECGERLTSVKDSGSLRVSIAPGARPLMGREEELDRLDEARRLVQDSPAAAYVTGPAGVGKTRLMAAFASRCSRDGDVVVTAAMHASGAPVPYAHIRQCVRELLKVDDAGLAAMVNDAQVCQNPAEKAGLSELLEPSGVPGLSGVPRDAAVAMILGRAIELAEARARSGRIVLLLDDLGRGDGLSRGAVRQLAELCPGRRVFVVITDNVLSEVSAGWPGLEIALPGLPQHMAIQFVKGGIALPECDVGGFLPLLAEQFRALRWEPSANETQPPALADAVARRMDELEAGPRRLLQTVAVLGNSASTELVRSMLSFQDLENANILEVRGFIRTDADRIWITHPFIRELVHASIPAEIRRTTHARALERLGARGAPLEERAEHAYRAGETMSAMMLMERMGSDAMSRGDDRLGVFAFQRALELARRELLETGDISLDQAIATFSRRLGQALLNAGHAARAAGVVGEVMQLVGPSSPDRARMLLLLADAAVKRDRPADARRQLTLARVIVDEVDNGRLRLEMERASARVLRAAGDALGACNALSTAWDVGEAEKESISGHLRVALDLADGLIDMGDLDGARERLSMALLRARSEGLMAHAAETLGVLASIDELDGERGDARQRYGEAASLSAQVGDVRAAQRWHRAAEALSAG